MKKIPKNTKSNSSRIVGVIALLLALMVMQSGYAKAQSPSQNYSAVKGTIGATAAMYGAAAAAGVCTLATAGMCAAAGAGGLLLGGVGVTLGMFGTPPPDIKGPSPFQMPDGDNDGVGNGGGGEDCGGGEDSGFLSPFCPE
jgi:hypothetical protein